MRKTLSALIAFLALPLMLATVLNASEARQVFPEVNFSGDEPMPLPADFVDGQKIPSPPRLMAVGTVVDSSTMDHQCNGTIHQRIAAVGDSALHATCMVSYDGNTNYPTRGMRYLYYFNGNFTNFGYVEGSGTGDQRAGYGMILGYSEPSTGLGNIAITATHTNLGSRAFGMHWYVFQDAFQGVGAFSPYEGPYGDGVNVCDDYLWPSLYVTNNPTGHMAMAGFTFDVACAGGIDDIAVTHKTFYDAAWDDPIILNTLDDGNAWVGGGPDIPSLSGADNGLMGVVTSDFGTNIYYWESTDNGITWGDRQNISGHPTTPSYAAPDTSSTEYRPLQNAAISVSPSGVPHAVWTAYQAQGTIAGSDTLYTPGVDGLWQYRTKLQHWDPVNGVTTVYRHPNGLSNFAGGTAFSYNVGHPAIGFDESGNNIYVVYEGFVDSDQDFTNGFYFGDIYVSVSTDGGATWQDRVNITSSTGSDDLYPSLARVNPQGLVQDLPGFSVGNPDGINDFVMIYQNDDVAGTFMRGDEPSPNFDMLLVAPVDFERIISAGIGDDNRTGGGASIPRAFALGQNYPNPFNPSTTISYQLAEDAQISIKVHNIRGQVVKELVSGTREAGTYSVQWNGEDDRGQKVSSGIYLYVLETSEGLRTTRKMVVLK